MKLKPTLTTKEAVEMCDAMDRINDDLEKGLFYLILTAIVVIGVTGVISKLFA